MSLSKEQYDLAVAKWTENISNFEFIQTHINPSYAFELSNEQVQNFLGNKQGCNSFCVEIGIHDDSLVMILCTLDSSGNKVEQDFYEYSTLSALNEEIILEEIQNHTIIKKTILSKNLEKVETSSNVISTVSNNPVLEQDKAVEIIESWKNEALDWFYRECSEFEGARIFQRFYVSYDDLSFEGLEINKINCVFGLKPSAVYQMSLPTLVFIGSINNENIDISINSSIISNVVDWAKPCPPICRLPGF